VLKNALVFGVDIRCHSRAEKRVAEANTCSVPRRHVTEFPVHDVPRDMMNKAYRFDRTGEGSLRAVYTFVYNGLINALFGVKVRDINFAFKLCRRQIFDDIELRSEGSFIDAELIIRATRMGYELMQMGVDYFPRTRGESTLSSPGVIVTILKEMWSLRADLQHIQKVK
jgi:hypothetical protein